MVWPLVRSFGEVGMDDVAGVGLRNALLGEISRELAVKGVKVPPGFALTAHAHNRFLTETGIDREIRWILAGLKTGDMDGLRCAGSAIRRLIASAPLPQALEQEIVAAHEKLCALGGAAPLAVRGCLAAADAEVDPSLQQQPQFIVEGAPALLQAVRQCYAAFFSDFAIARGQMRPLAVPGRHAGNVALSVSVQRLAVSEQSASGVMYTLDTKTGFRDVVLINAVRGHALIPLGAVGVAGVAGESTEALAHPDEYYVFKPTLNDGSGPIIQKKLGKRSAASPAAVLTHGSSPGAAAPNVRRKFVLSDEQIVTLARWGCLIEEQYSRRQGVPTPMDIEWIRDGISGELLIVQALPESMQARKDRGMARLQTINQRLQRVLDRLEHPCAQAGVK